MSAPQFTILIVSPDRGTLRLLTKFLDVFGYDVRQATNSEQALAAAEAAHPDFLIVDRALDESAGFQLCRAIRQSGFGAYTYCLLMAQQPEVGTITAALEAGFDDFLASPLVFGELLARLRAGARLIEYERRLGEQSGIDRLTGLADLAGITAELNRRSQGTKGVIGWLAIFDIDYFRRLADRVGRIEARSLLRQAAGLIAERTKAESFSAGIGQDRVAVLLSPHREGEVRTWCEETLSAISDARFTTGDTEHSLTASCGLHEVMADETFDTAREQAERALALAKASGRNCVVTGEDVHRDAESWTESAADGKLFDTTVAGDVMQPCGLVVNHDESLDDAYALLNQTGLSQAPVVDSDNRLVGLVSLEVLAGARARNGKSRPPSVGSSSVRLVRHIMSTDFTRLDEETPLAELMDHFTGSGAPLAVIVRDKRPRGLVHCQSLAALNERLDPSHFAQTSPRSGTSADLLVPELAAAE